MKEVRESSRANMKLVWWMGDWVPGDMGALVTDQTTSLTYNGLDWPFNTVLLKCLGMYNFYFHPDVKGVFFYSYPCVLFQDIQPVLN